MGVYTGVRLKKLGNIYIREGEREGEKGMKVKGDRKVEVLLKETCIWCFYKVMKIPSKS